VDEYGALQGLVTFEDILRSAFEDVEDAPGGQKEIVEREDGSLLVAGSLPLDEFFEYLETDPPGEDERKGMNTMGGFAMAVTGSLPAEGQVFQWRGWRFEIVDMDGNRVDKLLVSKIEEPEPLPVRDENSKKL
jgi:putative hemolysin